MNELCRRSGRSPCGLLVLSTLAFIPSLLAIDGIRHNGKREYCFDQKFNVTCGRSEVIMMTSAMFGRLRLGRCVKMSLGHVNCTKDALRLFDARCSGHQQCEVSIMDDELRKMEPCPLDTTWHLEASYDCVPVTTRVYSECNQQSGVELHGPSDGFLSSEAAAQFKVGSPTCPWVLVAPQGQTINISLYNFIYHPLEGYRRNSFPLISVGQITDLESSPSSISIRARGDDPRFVNIYNSKGNRIRIQFDQPKTGTASRTEFLLKYQFVGCRDFIPPEGTTSDREGKLSRVKCALTDETWTLTCDGKRWLGVHAIGNCTRNTAHTWAIDDIFQNDESFPFGILVVVAVGVALGIFLGGTLLLVVSVYMKRRHTRQDAHAMQEDAHGYHDATIPHDYYRKPELAEMEQKRDILHNAQEGRLTADEYKITEFRPPFYHVAYSPGNKPGPRNMPHVYESPKFT